MAPNGHEFHESDQEFLTPGLLRPQTVRLSAVDSCQLGMESPAELWAVAAHGLWFTG